MRTIVYFYNGIETECPIPETYTVSLEDNGALSVVDEKKSLVLAFNKDCWIYFTVNKYE